ncbi:thioredoxin family protein [Poriferisphaera sp. WC338]|uniref:thioredoxin family protein n=1 Tax=Poriferisphaera sp. WC338 TaxID=3425129 RepID=UPI003D81514B
MSLTPSTMQKLGTEAPAFKLLDVMSGKAVGLDDFAGSKAYLVMFICNHCPYVKHVADELARIGKEYGEKGVGILAINSNDVAFYPDDSPEKMKEEAEAREYVFPYLFDGEQSVAKAYGAACTPDFFVYDADLKLVYRGQLDDTRPVRVESGVYTQNAGANGKDLRAALDAVLIGEPVSADQKPSMGCNIKWKAGNEPTYF